MVDVVTFRTKSPHQPDRVPIEMVNWVQIKTHADAPLDIDRNLIIAQGNETPLSITFVSLGSLRLSHPIRPWCVDDIGWNHFLKKSKRDHPDLQASCDKAFGEVNCNPGALQTGTNFHKMQEVRLLTLWLT